MLQPRKVEDELEETLNAVTSGREPTADREKRYVYTVEVEDYRTFAMLKRQVHTTEAATKVPLLIQGVKPVIHMSDTSIEARMEVSIEEEQNRNEAENKSLEDFETPENQNA